MLHLMFTEWRSILVGYRQNRTFLLIGEVRDLCHNPHNGLIVPVGSISLFNPLNAKCIYTCMLTKRELSASPFMQCCVLYCVDQNHFEYACKCNTDMHVTT